MAFQDFYNTVQKLYIAYYQRPADPGGLRFWAQMLEAKGGSLEGIIDAFATSPEAASLYDTNSDGKIDGSDDLGALIDAIYQALFNRAPDAAGKQFYLNALQSGQFPDGRPATPGRVALDILNGAQGSDAVAIANKVQVANVFTQTLDPDNDGVPPYQATYSGDADAAQARVFLAQVTSDPATVKTQSQVTQFIQNQIANPGDPILSVPSGQTFTLTPGADALTGTTGNDTFVATEASLSSADIIDGNAGNDLFRYASSGNAAVNEAGFEIKNVETIQITADAGDEIVGGTTFDFTGTQGVQTIRNFNSSRDLTLTGLKTLAPTLEIESLGAQNRAAAVVDTTVVYDAATVAGKADAVNLKLSGNLNTDGSPVGKVTINGIETLNITSSGARSAFDEIASNTLQAMNIEGDADLTLNNANFFNAAAVNTVNASKFDGKLNITLTNSGAANIDVAVTGGTKDDRADFSNGFDKNDAFDGGDGTDTLALTNAVAVNVNPANFGTVKNVEILEITDGGANVGATVLDMDNFADVGEVYYSGLNQAGQNGLVGATTVQDTASTFAARVNNPNGQNLTVNVKTDGAKDELNLTFEKLAAGETTGTVTAAKFDTVNLTVSDDAGVVGTGDLTIPQLAINAAATLNISGNAHLTINNDGNPVTPVLTTLDAGNLTGNLTLTGVDLAKAGATVTLGSGDDTVKVATAAGADTYDLTKGGRDTIVYTAVAQSDKNMDTIKGFTSGDDIVDVRTLMGGIGVASSAQWAGNRATFAQAQGALSGITADAVFQVDEQILWVDSFTDGTLDNRDFRVKLDGVTGLTARDLGFGVGNTITLTAPGAVVNLTTKTNADNFSTVEDDTFNSTVANLAGSNLDGKGGNDVLNITDDLAGANLAGVTVASIERVNLLGGASAGSTMFNGATKIVSSAATNLTLGTGGQTYVGGDWVDTITDNTGNDRIETFGGNDVISIAFGGNDYVDAGAGNDTINAGTKLTTGDTIIGGAGTDTLNITNSNAANDLDNVSGIETINYTLTAATTHTTVDDLVAAGEVLNVNIAAGATNTLTFNGAAETDGRFVFTDAGTAQNHVITGGSGNDVFNFQAAAGARALNLDGGAGDDIFNLGANLTAADTIAGGAGNDTLTFSATGAATDLDGVTGVETIQYTGGAIVTALNPVDAVIAKNTTVTFDATKATGAAKFDFSNETDGSLIYKASGNGDTVKVANNQLSDTYILGAGADKVDITTGKNTIANIANVDTIQNFEAGVDTIDATKAGAGVFSVTLNTTTAGTFLGDLNTELTKLAHWNTLADAAGDVIVVTVNNGAMAGTYLVSDDTGGDGLVNGAAEVVKLVGLVGAITAADIV